MADVPIPATAPTTLAASYDPRAFRVQGGGFGLVPQGGPGPRTAVAECAAARGLL